MYAHTRSMLIVVALLVCGLTGCGSGGAHDARSPEPTADSRVERCVERMLDRVVSASTASEPDVRSYVERVYCRPFERNGWVYDDGALAIGAQEWLDAGGSERCETQTEGEAPRTVPCEELQAPESLRVMDCAVLHLVRRADVETYLDRLPERGVRCDDGTPLGELGIP